MSADSLGNEGLSVASYYPDPHAFWPPSDSEIDMERAFQALKRLSDIANVTDLLAIVDFYIKAGYFINSPEIVLGWSKEAHRPFSDTLR